MHNEKNLQQLCDDFINECQYSSRLRSETIRGYKEALQVFVKVMPEITVANLLTTDMIVQYFKRLQTRERLVGRGTIKVGVKNSTIKTYYTKINSFLEWLLRNKIILEQSERKRNK